MRTVDNFHLKNFSDDEVEILNLLSDGNFHSGVELGALVNKSRMTITSIMRGFRNVGLLINSVKGRGHQLSIPFSRIDCHSPLLAFIPQVVHFDSMDSSNLYMLKNREFADGSVVVAEFQTSGRGRRGRSFISLYGTQLMFSYGVNFAELTATQGLSILVGIVVAKVLKSNGLENIGIKWPNDIYCNGLKAGGILVESTASTNGCFVVIGIGLNISNSFLEQGEKQQQISQGFICLESACKFKIDRTKLLAEIVHELTSSIMKFKSESLAPFVDEFASLDTYANCFVKLVNDNKIITGKNLGINETGALKIETERGIETILCGDMSLRPLSS